MLKIYIDGKRIKLFKDTSISLSLNSQVFSKKTAYSFPFKIPRYANEEFFPAINNLGNLQQKKGSNCIIEHGGGFIIEGKAYIQNVTRTYIEMQFVQVPIENFLRKIKTKKINDIEYEETLPDFEQRINYYDDPPDANGDHTYNYAFAPVDITSENVLNYIQEQSSYTPQAVIMNYRQKIYESDFPDENYDIIPQYKDSEFKDGYGADSKRQQENNYDSNKLIYDINVGIMPFWRLKFVAEKIADFLNFTIQDNEIKDTPVFNSMLIYALHNVRFSGGVSGIKASFEYLPNVTIKEFLERLEEDLGILTFFDFTDQTISFKQKKNIIKSADLEEWHFPYRIKKSQPTEEKNIKYSFEELGDEIKLAKENGIFNDYETGEKNQTEKEIKSTSLPSHIEINSENTDKYYLQGWYTKEGGDLTEDTYRTIYANYNLPHAVVEPNGPKLDKHNLICDFIPDNQPLRFLIYNYDYDNKTRREYVRGAGDPSSILSASNYTGELYNFGHYRFYDDLESLDIDDTGYTGLYENFFKDVLFWESELKRNVQMVVQIPPNKLSNFNFLKKIKIGEDKFLFKDISLKLTNSMIEVDNINAFTVP